MTTTDLSTVREAALDLALATWYDEALRLLDATTPATGDAQGRVLLALTAADVADRADHVFGRSEAPKRFEALDAELAAYEPDASLAWNVAWVRLRRAYSLAIRNPDGSYRMGPGGREPGEADDSGRRGDPPARRGARRGPSRLGVGLSRLDHRQRAGRPGRGAGPLRGRPGRGASLGRPRPPVRGAAAPRRPRPRRRRPGRCARAVGGVDGRRGPGPAHRRHARAAAAARRAAPGRGRRGRRTGDRRRGAPLGERHRRRRCGASGGGASSPASTRPGRRKDERSR